MQADARRGLSASRVDSLNRQNDRNGSICDKASCPRHFRSTPISRRCQEPRHFSLSRVEDGRGSLGHSATLRFPSPLIEPDVPD
jgi:hypothetical protein